MFFLEGDGEGGTYARALHVVFGGRFVSGGWVFTPNLERFGSYWVGCYWMLDAIGCIHDAGKRRPPDFPY